MQKAVLVLLLLVSLVRAQNKSYLIFRDSVQYDKKTKLLLGFDSRRSFFADRNIKVFGLRMGAEYKRVHRFGLGFYFQNRPETFKGLPVNEPDATDTSLVRFSTGFAALFYERVVFHNRKWEFSVPIYLGSGNLNSEYTDTTGKFTPRQQIPFRTFGIAATGKYYVWPWLALGTGVGYRFVGSKSPRVQEAFQQPFYMLKVQVLFGELYRSIFKKEE